MRELKRMTDDFIKFVTKKEIHLGSWNVCLSCYFCLLSWHEIRTEVQGRINNSHQMKDSKSKMSKICLRTKLQKMSKKRKNVEDDIENKLKHLKSANSYASDDDLVITEKCLDDPRMMFDIPYVTIDFDNIEQKSRNKHHDDVSSESEIEYVEPSTSSAPTKPPIRRKKNSKIEILTPKKRVSFSDKVDIKNVSPEEELEKPHRTRRSIRKQYNSVKPSKKSTEQQIVIVLSDSDDEPVQNKKKNVYMCSICDKVFLSRCDQKLHEFEHNINFSPVIMLDTSAVDKHEETNVDENSEESSKQRKEEKESTLKKSNGFKKDIKENGIESISVLPKRNDSRKENESDSTSILKKNEEEKKLILVSSKRKKEKEEESDEENESNSESVPKKSLKNKEDKKLILLSSKRRKEELEPSEENESDSESVTTKSLKNDEDNVSTSSKRKKGTEEENASDSERAPTKSLKNEDNKSTSLSSKRKKEAEEESNEENLSDSEFNCESAPKKLVQNKEDMKLDFELPAPNKGTEETIGDENEASTSEISESNEEEDKKLSNVIVKQKKGTEKNLDSKTSLDESIFLSEEESEKEEESAINLEPILKKLALNEVVNDEDVSNDVPTQEVVEEEISNNETFQKKYSDEKEDSTSFLDNVDLNEEKNEEVTGEERKDEKTIRNDSDKENNESDKENTKNDIIEELTNDSIKSICGSDDSSKNVDLNEQDEEIDINKDMDDTETEEVLETAEVVSVNGDTEKSKNNEKLLNVDNIDGSEKLLDNNSDLKSFDLTVGSGSFENDSESNLSGRGEERFREVENLLEGLGA